MLMQTLEIQILHLVAILRVSISPTLRHSTTRIKTIINDSKTTSLAALRIEIPPPPRATETTINKHHSSNRISRTRVNLVVTNKQIETTTTVDTGDHRVPTTGVSRAKHHHAVDRTRNTTSPILRTTTPIRNSHSTRMTTTTTTIPALVDGAVNTMQAQTPAGKRNKPMPITAVMVSRSPEYRKGTLDKGIRGNTLTDHPIIINNNSSSSSISNSHPTILATNQSKDTMLAVLEATSTLRRTIITDSQIRMRTPLATTAA